MARPKSTHCKDCGQDLDRDPSYSKCRGELQRRNLCRECFNSHQRKANLNDPARIRDTQLKYRYGISKAEYDQMLEFQQGVCAICRKQCTSGRDLGTDHNHETGEVRGLLCHRCNRAMGLLKEDEDLILNMIEYLKRTTWNKISAS